MPTDKTIRITEKAADLVLELGITWTSSRRSRSYTAPEIINVRKLF